MENNLENNNFLEKIENNLNSEILEKKQENILKIDEIISPSEIQKKILELYKLKQKLKENLDFFGIFEEKFLSFYEFYKENKYHFSEKNISDFNNLEKFYKYFKSVKSKIRKTKTEIKKTKKTKREILIIGQTHFTYDGKGNIFAGICQEKIDIFLEYFLDENLFIGSEFNGTDEIFNYDEIIIGNFKNFLKNTKKAEFGKDGIKIFLEEDKKGIEKIFENFEMLTFYGKQYLKKDNEKIFYLISVLKYFINKLKKEKPWILSEINYEDFKISSLGKRTFVNIEVEENPINLNFRNFLEKKEKKVFLDDEVIIDLQENFFQNGVLYFLENNLEKLFKKYFLEENFFLEDLKEKIKSKHNLSENELFEEFSRKIIEIETNYIFSEFFKILENKDLKFNKKIQEIIFEFERKKNHLKENFENVEFINFFEAILNEIYDFFLFTYREEKSIENIEKFFPKNQRKIPIIFGAGHNKNWKKIVEKHNQENPENQYSLKIINFGFEEFNFK